MSRVFYSPQRWIVIFGALIVPTAIFTINAFRHAGDLVGAAIYLVGGYALGYGAYWFLKKANWVSSNTISDGKFLLRQYNNEVATEIENIQRLERANRGVWRLVFREPVHNNRGIELHHIELAEYSSWRKSKWREVFGAEVEIVS
jgi:hypothetical protein